MRTTNKSIAIIGEGKTEWFYFDTMRTSCRYHFKIVPGIPQHGDINHFLKFAKKSIKEEYDLVFCIFDMDRFLQNKKEREEYTKQKKEFYRAYGERVVFIETNPCTEFWFLLHFLPNVVTRSYTSCEELLRELRKYMPDYEKTEHYFMRINLYEYLKKYGDIEKALENSEKLCKLCQESLENKWAYSQIHKVILRLNELEAVSLH